MSSTSHPQQGSFAGVDDDLSQIDFSFPSVPATTLPSGDELMGDFDIDDFLVFPSPDSCNLLQQSSAADMPDPIAREAGIASGFIRTPPDPAFDLDSLKFDAFSSNITPSIDNTQLLAATSDPPGHAQNLLLALSTDQMSRNIDMNFTQSIKQIPSESTDGPPWALTGTPVSRNMDLSQSQYFHGSEYVSGYLACLEDLTNASQSQSDLQGSSVGHFPTEFNYYSKSSRMPDTSHQLTDFTNPIEYETEFNDVNLNFDNEVSQFKDNTSATSLVQTTSAQLEPISAKNPLRFVYMSGSGTAKNRLSSGLVALRRQQSKEASIAVRRRVARKKGAACGICGEQKAKCDAIEPSQPCQGCLKKALFNKALAFRLCFGYKTKAWHARAEISGFCGGPRYFEQYVWSLVPATKKRMIKLCGHPLSLNNELRIHMSYLELEVEELSTPSAAEVAGLLGVDISSPFYNTLENFLKTVSSISDSNSDQILLGQYEGVGIIDPVVSYRISEDSLQYLDDQLLKWNVDDLLFRYQHPPESHQGCLDGLLAAYGRRESPFSKLVITTLIATALARNLGDLCPVQILGDNEPDKNPTFVQLSRAARYQLFGVALQQFEEMETLVLKEIDELVYCTNSTLPWQADPHRSDPLIIGLCIRRMALEYRQMMLRYRGFRPKLVDRYENAQKMYDTMTRHYRHVFRGTLSPFDEDWKMEDHAAALGNDEELIRRLEEFKLSEENHCKNHLDPDDDGVYLNLFVKKQNRKGKSIAKSIGLI